MAWFEKLQKRVMESVDSDEDLKQAFQKYFDDARVDSQDMKLDVSDIEDVPEVFHLRPDPHSDEWWELSEEERNKAVPEYLEQVWLDYSFCEATSPSMELTSPYITTMLVGMLVAMHREARYKIRLELRTRTPLTLTNWTYEHRNAKISGRIDWTVCYRPPEIVHKRFCDYESGKEEEDNTETKLVVGRGEYFFSAKTSKTLAYMGMIHQARKRASHPDCSVYGIASSGSTWSFLRIDHDSAYSHKRYTANLTFDRDIFRMIDRFLVEIASTKSAGLKKGILDEDGERVEVPIDEAGGLYWR
ncbi:hypothetical protein BO78DRAFT_384247 [Aspergillus sclerotiicarbonarius CBS 121057]|uniref:Uncharacterized protein n=1 Tax=Aspergillus sclerotiicarbonarius (strain CBS 121057 / IBT 28362) TaxID=1448318 RepID=A0A319ER30_ASPSB|nr:hypothetical protein BO78DRAFT_384247 [Aspergillus sclerotiicarbonarius CBS 121057]